MTIVHFEKVRVTASQQFPERIGCVGIVLGISSDDAQVYGYTVYFNDEAPVATFGPEEIAGLNEFVDKSEIYDEKDRVAVRVIHGQGYIVE